MAANIWEGKAAESLVRTRSAGCNSLPLNMWVGLFHSCCVLFTTLLGRCNFLLWYRVSENAVVETVAMVANQLPSISPCFGVNPPLLRPQTPGAADVDLTWRCEAPHIPCLYGICSLVCLIALIVLQVSQSKGSTLQSTHHKPSWQYWSCLRSQSIRAYLVLMSGVLCLDGWEFISLSGLTKEFNRCFAWSGIRHMD